MSMINRPFRGFSGTFTRPELPLSHPEIPLDAPVHVVSAPPAQPASSSQPSGSEPSASPVAAQRSRKPSQPTSTQDASPRPPHSRKPSSRLLRSISGIFAAKHTDTPSSSFRRKSKTCEATAPCKNSSNVIIYHGNHTFSEKEKGTFNYPSILPSILPPYTHTSTHPPPTLSPPKRKKNHKKKH